MSLDIKVYCGEVSGNLVRMILKRLNDFDMIVEVHPDFTFHEENDTGFVPFKFRFKNPTLEILKDKEIKSGFELYIDDFDLEQEKKNLQPNLNFIDRILGKKRNEIPFAPPEIEKRLKECNKAVSFVWHAGDSFQLRFASLVSAILTELTNGVCCYPADDIWYENRNIVDEAFKEVCEYEQSLSVKEIQLNVFDKW